MSAIIVDEIIEKASQLPDIEKAIIAARLIETLPKSRYDVTDAEVEERRKELESGKGYEISMEELREGLELRGN